MGGGVGGGHVCMSYTVRVSPPRCVAANELDVLGWMLHVGQSSSAHQHNEITVTGLLRPRLAEALL